MKTAKTRVLLSTLLLLSMLVSPLLPAFALQGSSEPASPGSIENMIVGVYEDESVASGHPDLNYDGNVVQGGVWVGYDGGGAAYSRAWLKYDLRNIPKEVGILSVHVNVYLNTEYSGTEDLPIAVHYSENNTWSETTITWNNQPSFDAVPEDLIDSPASPDMFAPGNWYSWDVTLGFSDALSKDKMLTLVMKQVDEAATNITWAYFVEKDYNRALASYLSVEYSTPDTTELAVDGQTTTPGLEQIRDSTPELSWSMTDPGTGEYQRDFELEVNADSGFSGTSLWDISHTYLSTIHDSNASSNTRPFATNDEMRFQMKFETSLLEQSGMVDKLQFEVREESGTMEFENFTIVMVNTPLAGDLTADFQSNYGTARPTTVLKRTVLSAPIVDYWFTVDIENAFFLNARQNLIIELWFTNSTGTLTTTNYTSSIGGSVAYNYGAGAIGSYTAPFVYPRGHSVKVEFMSTELFESDGASTNAYPFNTDNGYPCIFQLKYNKSMIHQTGVVDSIVFPAAMTLGDVVFEGFEVYLAESPVLGELSHTNFAQNYGGSTPVKVLDEATYRMRNLDGAIVIDIDNVFEYTGEHDLLIEIAWDNKISGGISVYRTLDAGGYRAYNLTSSSTNLAANDSRTYDAFLTMVHSENLVEYAGTDLLNGTTYYWRVRTCDSTGIWSDWVDGSFKWEPLAPSVFDPMLILAVAGIGLVVVVVVVLMQRRKKE